MPWQIRFVENPPLHPKGDKYDSGTVHFDKLEVGDLCYYHFEGKPCLDRAQLDKLHLAAHYFANNSHRPPLILALPDKPSGKLYFMVDGQCYNDERKYYDGWTVTGEPPLITVDPSVDYLGHYHGRIKAGVIGDG